MTPFSTDRDLLALEPEAFNDLAFFAQLRVSVNDAEVTQTDLTSVNANFETAQIEPGHIAVVDRHPCEVVARTDAMSLTLSALRTQTSDPAIPPTVQGAGLSLRIRTFAPQARLVGLDLLQALGVDPEDATAQAENRPTEDAILSLNRMAQLEALGTLHRLYAAASAVDTRQEAFLHKAEHYRSAFREALRKATVLIDVNQDGLPEERRSFAVAPLRRA
ncbi:MAG: hypothetical protein AAGA57_04025 [Planctomycetota bacterium]